MMMQRFIWHYTWQKPSEDYYLLETNVIRIYLRISFFMAGIMKNSCSHKITYSSINPLNLLKSVVINLNCLYNISSKSTTTSQYINITFADKEIKALFYTINKRFSIDFESRYQYMKVSNSRGYLSCLQTEFLIEILLYQLQNSAYRSFMSFVLFQIKKVGLC